MIVNKLSEIGVSCLAIGCFLGACVDWNEGLDKFEQLRALLIKDALSFINNLRTPKSSSTFTPSYLQFNKESISTRIVSGYFVLSCILRCKCPSFRQVYLLCLQMQAEL